MKEIVEKLKDKYNVWFMLDDEDNEMLIQDLENAEREERGLPLFEEGERKDLKSFKLPKNITEAWIEKKILAYIEGGTNYKNLSAEFSKLVKDVRFYSTTYGLGTHIALDSPEEARDRIKPVLDKLDKNKIEYKLQYSDAFWVYRIVFSKSAENLKKIAALSKSSAPKMR